ncbi:MAG: ABC transporter ATP-binding protein [Christensenellaceae bacterium]|jgi:ABC-2 type transport system ATP-binding protein|nr:ABC transporter ATP-binding protein [Christensenellaceae bacterium]
MLNTENSVQLSIISKKFHNNIVLDGVNLDIKAGTIIGITGKNGAGKTTLLKIILGYITDFAGIKDLGSSTVSALIEMPVFYDSISGLDNLNYMLNNNEYIRALEIAKSFKLGEYLNKQVKKYSLGMKQKLGLAVVLSRDADIYLIDEPFNSLDMESIDKSIDIIKDYKSKGKTIIIVSHNMSRVGIDCDQIYMIKNANLIQINSKNKTPQVVYIAKFNNVATRDAARNLIGDFKTEKLNDNSLSIILDRNDLNILLKRLSDSELIEIYENHDQRMPGDM